MLGVGGFRRGRKAVEFLSVSCVRDPYKNSDSPFFESHHHDARRALLPSLASSSVRVSVSHSPPAPPPRARDVSYDVSLLFQQRTYHGTLLDALRALRPRRRFPPAISVLRDTLDAVRGYKSYIHAVARRGKYR